MIVEAESLKWDMDEVKGLAEPILSYLAAFTEAPAKALEDKIEKLNLAVNG